MKAVLGHGTGPCAMEKLIQLINYCSCLPQHQSRDPLAPAARAKREGIFNYSWALHPPFAVPEPGPQRGIFPVGARGKSTGATSVGQAVGNLDPTSAPHLAQGAEYTSLLPAQPA